MASWYIKDVVVSFQILVVAFFSQAIHGFRETEKSHWNESNNKVISRVCQQAFPSSTDANWLPHIHVLDLADNG